MVVIDTNVFSELMKPVPDLLVLRWLTRNEWNGMCLTAISVAEVEYGLRRLPEGRRKQNLQRRFVETLDANFDGQVLPFDVEAAHVYGHLLAQTVRAGMNVGELDIQIAAIAHVHGAILATRNTRDFEHCGLTLIDPWLA